MDATMLSSGSRLPIAEVKPPLFPSKLKSPPWSNVDDPIILHNDSDSSENDGDHQNYEQYDETVDDDGDDDNNSDYIDLTSYEYRDDEASLIVNASQRRRPSFSSGLYDHLPLSPPNRSDADSDDYDELPARLNLLRIEDLLTLGEEERQESPFKPIRGSTEDSVDSVVRTFSSRYEEHAVDSNSTASKSRGPISPTTGEVEYKSLQSRSIYRKAMDFKKRHSMRTPSPLDPIMEIEGISPKTDGIERSGQALYRKAVLHKAGMKNTGSTTPKTPGSPQIIHLESQDERIDSPADSNAIDVTSYNLLSTKKDAPPSSNFPLSPGVVSFYNQSGDSFHNNKLLSQDESEIDAATTAKTHLTLNVPSIRSSDVLDSPKEPRHKEFAFWSDSSHAPSQLSYNNATKRLSGNAFSNSSTREEDSTINSQFMSGKGRIQHHQQQKEQRQQQNDELRQNPYSNNGRTTISLQEEDSTINSQSIGILSSVNQHTELSGMIKSSHFDINDEYSVARQLKAMEKNVSIYSAAIVDSRTQLSPYFEPDLEKPISSNFRTKLLQRHEARLRSANLIARTHNVDSPSTSNRTMQTTEFQAVNDSVDLKNINDTFRSKLLQRYEAHAGFYDVTHVESPANNTITSPSTQSILSPAQESRQEFGLNDSLVFSRSTDASKSVSTHLQETIDLTNDQTFHAADRIEKPHIRDRIDKLKKETLMSKSSGRAQDISSLCYNGDSSPNFSTDKSTKFNNGYTDEIMTLDDTMIQYSISKNSSTIESRDEEQLKSYFSPAESSIDQSPLHQYKDNNFQNIKTDTALVDNEFAVEHLTVDTRTQINSTISKLSNDNASSANNKLLFRRDNSRHTSVNERLQLSNRTMSPDSTTSSRNGSVRNASIGFSNESNHELKLDAYHTHVGKINSKSSHDKSKHSLLDNDDTHDNDYQLGVNSSESKVDVIRKQCQTPKGINSTFLNTHNDSIVEEETHNYTATSNTQQKFQSRRFLDVSVAKNLMDQDDVLSEEEPSLSNNLSHSSYADKDNGGCSTSQPTPYNNSSYVADTAPQSVQAISDDEYALHNTRKGLEHFDLYKGTMNTKKQTEKVSYVSSYNNNAFVNGDDTVQFRATNSRHSTYETDDGESNFKAAIHDREYVNDLSNVNYANVNHKQTHNKTLRNQTTTVHGSSFTVDTRDNSLISSLSGFRSTSSKFRQRVAMSAREERLSDYEMSLTRSWSPSNKFNPRSPSILDINGTKSWNPAADYTPLHNDNDEDKARQNFTSETSIAAKSSIGESSINNGSPSVRAPRLNKAIHEADVIHINDDSEVVMLNNTAGYVNETEKHVIHVDSPNLLLLNDRVTLERQESTERSIRKSKSDTIELSRIEKGKGRSNFVRQTSEHRKNLELQQELNDHGPQINEKAYHKTSNDTYIDTSGNDYYSQARDRSLGIAREFVQDKSRSNVSTVDHSKAEVFGLVDEMSNDRGDTNYKRNNVHNLDSRATPKATLKSAMKKGSNVPPNSTANHSPSLPSVSNQHGYVTNRTSAAATKIVKGGNRNFVSSATDSSREQSVTDDSYNVQRHSQRSSFANICNPKIQQSVAGRSKSRQMAQDSNDSIGEEYITDEVGDSTSDENGTRDTETVDTESKVSLVSILDTEESEDTDTDLYDTFTVPFVVQMLDRSCAWLEDKNAELTCGYTSKPSLLRETRLKSPVKGPSFNSKLSRSTPKDNRRNTNESKSTKPAHNVKVRSLSKTTETQQPRTLSDDDRNIERDSSPSPVSSSHEDEVFLIPPVDDKDDSSEENSEYSDGRPRPITVNTNSSISDEEGVRTPTTSNAKKPSDFNDDFNPESSKQESSHYRKPDPEETSSERSSYTHVDTEQYSHQSQNNVVDTWIDDLSHTSHNGDMSEPYHSSSVMSEQSSSDSVANDVTFLEDCDPEGDNQENEISEIKSASNHSKHNKGLEGLVDDEDRQLHLSTSGNENSDHLQSLRNLQKGSRDWSPRYEAEQPRLWSPTAELSREAKAAKARDWSPSSMRSGLVLSPTAETIAEADDRSTFVVDESNQDEHVSRTSNHTIRKSDPPPALDLDSQTPFQAKLQERLARIRSPDSVSTIKQPVDSEKSSNEVVTSANIASTMKPSKDASPKKDADSVTPKRQPQDPIETGSTGTEPTNRNDLYSQVHSWTKSSKQSFVSSKEVADFLEVTTPKSGLARPNFDRFRITPESEPIRRTISQSHSSSNITTSKHINAGGPEELSLRRSLSKLGGTKQEPLIVVDDGEGTDKETTDTDRDEEDTDPYAALTEEERLAALALAEKLRRRAATLKRRRKNREKQ